MPRGNSNWVKKTLGACLAFSFSTLIIHSAVHTTPAFAHAEHGSEGGGAVMELFSIPPQDMPAICYTDLYTDKARMELSYMGRGNTLAYERAK